ncbi:flavin reductase family protein [Actinophytocola oryzae]|uniref:Flavin reductase (DIM6/NTAB) family NADH-FMN oxidoreductase RutF n=1 Tax=Actinophytocola oryzae TaxID=502181 RepID=A0A4R7VJP0_9PSEU|nr:flavin reductase family protein [Actinophytocola oryzae]TDV49664.1 flavin reductase (DIM6/NTAB) family NADH-FMN oxidoreductase RutF [Actinophytocola oryzae]
MREPMGGAVAPVDSGRFRALMATFPTGVAVVTATEVDGSPRGMTCSSVCSVSVRPPTLLVCLREGSPTLSAVLGLAGFAVNLLHDEARPVAELFASGDPDRFDRVGWARDPSFAGPHLVDDAHTIADCRVTRTVRVGDHAVVFGEVHRLDLPTASPPRPLLYGLRRYWAVGQPRSET